MTNNQMQLPAKASGSDVIVETLRQLGVTTVFGIVGIPVVEVADKLIAHGVRFVAFRNEQAALYAASIYGYLTGKPGVLLVVGGPGVVHATAGILNANSNCWPLVVLAGSAGLDETQKGAFQELDQVLYLAAQTKFAARPFTVLQVPRLLERAYRTSYYGVPGATYVDLPANVIQQKDVDRDELVATLAVAAPSALPNFLADPTRVAEAARIIAAAKSPLLIVGKGAAYADAAFDAAGPASAALQHLVDAYGLPFLPTPMGKGVVPDLHPRNVSLARLLALASADVIVLCGARLNWILHHGERFGEGAKVIAITNAPEEIGNNSSALAQYGLLGDVALVAQQLAAELHRASAAPAALAPSLRAKMRANETRALATENRPTGSEPLAYQRVYKVIRDVLAELQGDRPTTFVSEGANTMDILRTSFALNVPRRRLDAGTNATMGVGIAYAIAAQLARPHELVVALEGDSAFGFSGMELETIARNRLGVIIVVMNNSGIYHGLDPALYAPALPLLPLTALLQNTRYDVVAQGLGIHGAVVRDEAQLERAFAAAIAAARRHEATLINVEIDLGLKTTLSFGWQNKGKGKL